ncbi:MAG: tRNA pseudouridine(55) synthase TruB [Deltaproteobacteria bacterium]|nr:tRNA pseudouridine(55) synthase TruB [Deltaproteobacteria bacterium]
MRTLTTEAGILLVDKPAGLSSAQVVGRLKKKHGCKRIGHAGTLDPMATGLLVCMVGAATRLASYAEAGSKIYAGTIDFGYVTDTDDIWGEVLNRSENLPIFSEVCEGAKKYCGQLWQVPPRISAVKVRGQRAYQAARVGKPLKLEPRQVYVHKFDLLPVSRQRVFFRVHCSKGTYIRSLARDLGADLGCGACLSSLRREASAPFSVSKAKPLEQLGVADLQHWSRLFPETPRLDLDAWEIDRLRDGDQRLLGALSLTGSDFAGAARLVYADRVSGRACGLLVKRQDSWRLAVNLS